QDSLNIFDKFFDKGFYYKIILTAVMIFSAFGLHAERWKMHPAFDNTPVRIVDTENYTFFHVLQKMYNTSIDTYNEPVGACLIYDKNDPEKGIVPANEVLNLHGINIHTCEYSPEGKFLAILYGDGSLDIVHDSGVINHNETLKEINLPGWSVIKSMTLSGKDICIAAGDGYVVIDSATASPAAVASLGMELDRIGQSGGNIILLSDGKIYESATGKYPRLSSELKEIVLSGGPGNARMLMPRSDGSFMYIADKQSAGSHSLNIAWKKEGKWVNRHITDLWLPVQASTATLGNIFEKNFVRNKEGWCLYTDGAIRQLYIDRDAEKGELVTIFATKKKETPTADRSISIAGSWDNSGCWTYFDRGRFAKGVRKDNTFLIDDASALRPNIPAVSHATHLGYSDKYGTLAVNYGYSWKFPSLTNNLPPLLSAYKDGKWTLPNPIYMKPRSAEENEELGRLYNSNTYRFPVSNPNGMAVDPVNGNYVWLSSVFAGLGALNLADPKSDPIHLGAPTDPLAGYPGFYELFEETTKWRGYNPASEPSFDGAGNLWFAYHNYDGALSKEETEGFLYCWNKENRGKVLSTGDVSSVAGITVFKLPGIESINSTLKCYATAHPKNKNIVFMYVSGSPRWAARLNHGGTLEDTTDDVVEKITHIEDQNGARWPITYWYSAVEDPLTGLLWLGESDTLVCFDPAAEVKNGIIKGWVLDIESGERGGNVLSYTSCYSVTIDDDNRLWVATSGRGVYCISADRKKIEAHYTTANSALPHNDVYTLVWNPSTRSLMMSTKEGLCEVWPDLPAVSSAGSASVYPREIKSDYAGKLTVRGVVPGSEIVITDKRGESVASFKADASGTVMWDLLNRNGERVETGFYSVKGDFGSVDIVVR
ncbi:MAG: hypothetical protein K2L89_07525, partial [Muribaculaceae bacterium]|nr:hypothetical protein [Muribaculaceae bacterium]